MTAPDGRECHHDESYDSDCEVCEAVFAHEEAYWRWYFGEGQIREAAERNRDERETYGRTLTDDERLEEARRLK